MTRALYPEILRVAPCSGKAFFLAATVLLASNALGQEAATVHLAQANAKTVPAAMIVISQ
jgi:hypothetical protein